MTPGDLVTLADRVMNELPTYDRLNGSLPVNGSISRGESALLLEIEDPPDRARCRVLLSNGTIGWTYTYYLRTVQSFPNPD
jgi:hypothetical protein